MSEGSPENDSIGPETAQRHPGEGEKNTTGTMLRASSAPDPEPLATNAGGPKREKKHWTDYVKLAAEILTLLVVCFYTKSAYDQLHEMQKTTKATQEAADAAFAQMRPWIKINSVELRKGSGPIKTLMFHWPMTGKVVPPVLQVKVSVTNVGHTVAQGVKVYPELFFGQFNANTWHDVVSKEEARYCKSVANRAPTSGYVDTVFPSDSKSWYMGVGGIIPGDKNPASALIVCVNYGGESQSHSQTQAWFGLYEKRSVFINITSDANADSLQLIRDESGDHAY